MSCSTCKCESYPDCCVVDSEGEGGDACDDCIDGASGAHRGEESSSEEEAPILNKKRKWEAPTSPSYEGQPFSAYFYKERRTFHTYFHLLPWDMRSYMVRCSHDWERRYQRKKALVDQVLYTTIFIKEELLPHVDFDQENRLHNLRWRICSSDGVWCLYCPMPDLEERIKNV